MRFVIPTCFIGFSLLGVLGACTVTTNSTTPTDIPDGSVTPVPTGDAGVDTDASTCNKAPPSGTLTLAAAAPAGSDNAYGQESALALDKNGYPMLAFSTNGDSGQLFFSAWDPCAGAWKAAAVVDAIGDANENGALREVNIATDPTSGAIALVYVKQIPDGDNPSAATWIAKSTDGGATWTKEQLSIHPADEAGDIHDTESPAVTFANGKIWVAYSQAYVWCDGAFKDSGNQKRCEGFVLNGDSGNWTRQVFQRASNGALAAGQIGLETDSAGNVGIAFVSDPDSGYNRIVSFWRPGAATGQPAATPVEVFNSNNEQNDDPTVSLTFFGTKPRIAAQIVQDTSETANALYSQSDDGVTWSAVVKVPRDVTRNTDTFQALVSDSTGKLSLLAYDNGGTDATPTCGDPQVMRSTDGTTWTPFCVETTMQDGVTGGKYISAKVGPDDKLQLVFYNNPDPGETNPGTGVVYWHE